MSVAEPTTAGLETAAAARLYERHSSRVFRFCLRKLGSREDAEDATQTTFMQAFRALQRGVVPTFETAWLLTIARNVCHARYRSSSRRRAVELVRDPQDIEELAAGVEAVEASLMGLQEALARLPEMQRRAFLLREWQGRSYAEIGEELGVTVPAVEALIFRARRALAQDLRGETKKRGHVFDFASLLAGAVKALMGGGTAVKIAVGAATVVSAGAVVGGAVQIQQEDPPAPRPAQPVRELRTSPSASKQTPTESATRPVNRAPTTSARVPARKSRTGVPRKKPGDPGAGPGSSAPGAPAASAPQSPTPIAPGRTAPQPAPPAAAPTPAPQPQPAAPLPETSIAPPPPPLQLPVVEEVTEQLPVQLPELPDTSEVPVLGPIVDPVVDDVLDDLPLGLGGG